MLGVGGWEDGAEHPHPAGPSPHGAGNVPLLPAKAREQTQACRDLLSRCGHVQCLDGRPPRGKWLLKEAEQVAGQGKGHSAQSTVPSARARGAAG